MLMLRGALAALWSVACLVATPALAITFGIEDGDAHPNVGALLSNQEPIRIVCAGTLISSKVFLTAASCVNKLAQDGDTTIQVFVTFDSKYDADSKTYQGNYHVNPNFESEKTTPNNPNVAVVVFDRPIQRITPASLPAFDYLDDLNAQGLLKDEQFVTVGYGAVREDKTKGPESIYPIDGVRRNATGTFSALTDASLKISMNPSTDDGGTCIGDGGGPHMLNSKVVSITSNGDINCRATDVTYRLGIESARAYLKDFVTLP